MLDNPDLVSQSWSKAATDVPKKEGQQINLLDARIYDVQQAALEKFAPGTLFMNQQEKQADELEDLMGETAINEGDEVPVENLANIWSKTDPTQLSVMMKLMTICMVMRNMNNSI